MSVRTKLLETAHKLRRLPGPGPGNFDVYTASVTIRRRAWTGGDYGAEVRTGTSSDTDLTISPRPKVRDLGNGMVEVGPITPANALGGYTVAQLNPLLAAAQGVEVYYLVVGPNGTNTYTLVDIDHSRAFRYMLRLQVLERIQPQ